MVAFIPARKGSTRLINKNLRKINGHSLLAYAIVAAKNSTVFNRIVVSTDGDEIAEEARRYGADVINRPNEISQRHSTDLEWIRHALEQCPTEEFMIVRATNPFRTSHTLLSAYSEWQRVKEIADSMRSVRQTKPLEKHWIENRQHVGFITQLISKKREAEFLCDLASQEFHRLFVQTGCLQICKAKTIDMYGNHTGMKVWPFFTDIPEALDVDTMFDYMLVMRLAETGAFPLERMP